MHCACVFAARVRWEGRIRKSLGFQGSRCQSRLNGGRAATSDNEIYDILESKQNNNNSSSSNNNNNSRGPDDPTEFNSDPLIQNLATSIEKLLLAAGLSAPPSEILRLLSVAKPMSQSESSRPHMMWVGGSTTGGELSPCSSSSATPKEGSTTPTTNNSNHSRESTINRIISFLMKPCDEWQSTIAEDDGSSAAQNLRELLLY